MLQIRRLSLRATTSPSVSWMPSNPLRQAWQTLIALVLSFKVKGLEVGAGNCKLVLLTGSWGEVVGGAETFTFTPDPITTCPAELETLGTTNGLTAEGTDEVTERRSELLSREARGKVAPLESEETGFEEETDIGVVAGKLNSR